MALQISARVRSRRVLLWLFIGCWFCLSGFSYQLALPGRKLVFPADHYSHPDFKTEWWYYTGHLTSESGRAYGYQVTFFRFGLRDKQEANSAPWVTDLYMAHFALSDIRAQKFSFRERINRGFAGNAGGRGFAGNTGGRGFTGDGGGRGYNERAGAATDRFLVWNENWRVSGDGNHHQIFVSDRGTELKLSLKSLKPPVLHGDNGHSQKGEGEGRASYYYSLTRMQTDGELTIAGKKEKVAGLTWMDHEFGSNQLRDDQVGWDWFSIQLDNHTEVMLYLMRKKDGSVDAFSSGTLVDKNGATKHLARSDYRIDVLERWKSPKSGASYPMKWRVAIPSEAIALEIVPAFPEQELITNRSTRVTYWEGAVGVTGTVRGAPIRGQGYVEMTGYAGKLNI